MSCSTINRKETEKNKLIQEKCQSLLTQMLRDEDNKYCVDCDAKGPRWASWNLGVFLCIRCAGIHRNLGVHISRVKSVNLDSWTPEQVISLQQMGNSRARAVYEAQLPDGFRRPQTDTALESFIRAKYEHKKYLAREWVPPLPPKVDWAKEIDEELERQKRKKKATQANSTLGIGGLLGCGMTDDKKHTLNSKPMAIPAPLSKSKNVNSPKIQRTANIENPANANESNQSNDLLGLSSPTKPIQQQQNCLTTAADNFESDGFNSFLSAAAAAATATAATNETHSNMINNPSNSLAKEEKDFFNQGNICGGVNEKDKSGKLTKDSILALYGQTTPNTINTMNFLPQQQHQQHQHQQLQQQVGQAGSALFAHSNNFTGLTPGSYVGAGRPVNMQPQQQQFMTPPNSTSMYNSPVMTAPAAFTAPGLGGLHHMNAGTNAGFAGHYQMQVAYPPTANLSITNPLVVNNTFAFRGTASNVQPLTAAYNPNMLVGAYPVNPLIPTGGNSSTIAAASSAANVQQQFGKLNISNAWQ